uniref:Uncharacterized protein n=1 Tax=Anguilla anguilla TaxID=7936 RepID=A0A0E9QGB8_ANGAN
MFSTINSQKAEDVWENQPLSYTDTG